MIVNDRQLVACRHCFGYSRYGGSWEQGRNFTYPDGRPGLINGLVAEVPAGTDITPFNSLINQGSSDINCQSLSIYVPPTTIDYYLEMGGANPSPVMTRVDTDLKMYDMAGGLINLFGDLFARRHCGSFSYFMGGINGGGTFSVSPKEILINYKSPRGGTIEIVEYEQGADGIVTAEILTGAPYAVQALRLSDQTQQILAKGGLALPAGAGQIKIRISWASGLPATALLAKIRFSIEVPYGI